ncbi:MAG TPA: L-seryl-tRNA(Sec) selenium transferase, partial [Acidobacteriota bacterium]|nr:L-seryl-tRNA(Sec) selenium transferase [Acidobacteriota bacterium]
GFTEAADVRSLAELAGRAGIPLVEDIGSGCLVDLKRFGIMGEPMARESLSAGVDLICFSGDKLLGGPQAGIIAGAGKLVNPVRHNPMMRTYRVDKLVYGALQATLESYRFGKAEKEIPVIRMIAMSIEEARKRARSFRRRLKAKLPSGIDARLVDGGSVIGGGSCPEHIIPSVMVALESTTVRPAAVESHLRSQKIPIIIRLEDDRALIDLRTVFQEQEPALIEGICRAVAASGVTAATP